MTTRRGFVRLSKRIRNTVPFVFGGFLAVSAMGGCQQKTSPAAVPVTSAAGQSTSVHNPDRALPFASDVRATISTSKFQLGVDDDAPTLLETVGGGVAVFDFDRDGLPDLWQPCGGSIRREACKGEPSSLQRNRGRWAWLDATKPALGAGNRDPRPYSHGAFAGDFDADGFDDMLETGYGAVVFWRNQGDGTFVRDDVCVPDSGWSTGAAWTDINGDGLLDLYVSHYLDWSYQNHRACQGKGNLPDVCSPREFSGQSDSLWLNQGDGGFRDASREMGLTTGGKGLGVLTADFDHDGDQDVYVANDTSDNFLYVNQGGNSLLESGVASGCAVDDRFTPNGSMGIALFDENDDLLPDIWVSNFESEVSAIYRNEGDARFQFVSDRLGLRRLGVMLVSFGVTTADYDADGDEDVIIANGHITRHPRLSDRLQPLVGLVRDGAAFERVSWPDRHSFHTPRVGRGLAQGDLDFDGDFDVVSAASDRPMELMENVGAAERSLWIQPLRGRDGRSPIGLRAVLTTAKKRQLRHLPGGGSYLSTNETALHFGWPKDDVPIKLDVVWPDGSESQIRIPHPLSTSRWILRCDGILLPAAATGLAQIARARGDRYAVWWNSAW